MNYFTISQISKISALPVRKIRYVIDNNVGPIVEADEEIVSPGEPRCFDELNSTLIVCSAKLLAAGVQRKTVNAFLKALVAIPWRKVRSKHGLMGTLIEFYDAKRFEAHFADSTHVRCCWNSKDSGWRNATEEMLAEDKSFLPAVTITLDLHAIRLLF